MLTPVKHDNNGFVSINNINNEPMLKIIDKGNGAVDLNSASDKNVLSIGATGSLTAKGNLNLNGASHLNMETGDLNTGVDGVLDVRGGLNISSSNRGTVDAAADAATLAAGGGVLSIPVNNSNVTANSIILITIKSHTSGAINGVYVSTKTANTSFTVNNTNCVGTFDYVIIN